MSDVEKLTPYMNVEVGGVYGGTNMSTKAAMVLQGLDILVGIPGRILDLAAIGSLQLKHIKKVVVDEVDETLSLGFRPQSLRIFEFLTAKKQHMVFSATLSEEVADFLGDYLTAQVRIEATRAGSLLEKIDQVAYKVENFLSKVALLQHLLDNAPENSKTLVFVSSRSLAESLYEAIEPYCVGS